MKQNHSLTSVLTAEMHVHPKGQGIYLIQDLNHTGLPSSVKMPQMEQHQSELQGIAARKPSVQAALRRTIGTEVRVLSNRHMEPDPPEPNSLMKALAQINLCGFPLKKGTETTGLTEVPTNKCCVSSATYTVDYC